MVARLAMCFRLDTCLHISWAVNNLLDINFSFSLEDMLVLDKMDLHIAALFDNDSWYKSTCLVLNSGINLFQVFFAKVLVTWLCEEANALI